MMAQYHFQRKRYSKLAREVKKKGYRKVCEGGLNHVERGVLIIEKTKIIRLKGKLAS